LRRRNLNQPASLVTSIARWQLLTIALVSAIAASLGALVVLNQRYYEPQVRDSIDAITTVRLTHLAMLDQQTGLRAYAVTGDTEFLEAYDDGATVLDELNARAEGLVEGSALPLFLEFRLRQAAWIEGWADEALEIGEARGQDPEAPATDLDAFLLEGKALFDEYRVANEELTAEIVAQRDAALDAQSTAINRTAGLALALAIGAVTFAIWRGRRLRNEVGRGLWATFARLGRMQSGDLSRSAERAGPEELARIQEGLDETAGRLAAARAQVDEQAARLAIQNHQLAQVLQLAREVAGSLNLRYVVRGVCQAASNITGGLRVIVWVRADGSPLLAPQADSGSPGFEVIGLDEVELGAGVVGRAARFGRVEGHSGSSIEPGPTAFDEQVGQRGDDAEAIAVPMVVGAEVIGVLEVVGGGSSRLPEPTLHVLEALAVQAATAIGAARIHELTEVQAMTDALTHLPNRRRLEADLAREAGVSQRHGRPLGFAMIDIDKFKAYNDTLGHQAADAALQELAALLAGSVRAGDTVYRYGGEEIAVIMRETDAEGARVHAERLREAVEHAFSAPGQPRAVTISAGVASMPAHGTSARELVAAADAALYKAKRRGRNRVCSPGTP